jgi:hypothetical protein
LLLDIESQLGGGFPARIYSADQRHRDTAARIDLHFPAKLRNAVNAH